MIEAYADYLWAHVIPWTVTTRGDLVPGLPRHFVRINPARPEDADPESVDDAIVTLANQPPDEPREFPARNVVDAGFLLLARFGIFDPNHPVISDSVQVIDHLLRVETPFGPCWRRFNHDGFGEKEPGEPFGNWGRGRAWPLIAGEGGHYELSAGHDPMPLVRAMEGFAIGSGLLPEQVWDVDAPDNGVHCGRPTGAAMPLMWAHAEYLKLLRSFHDRRCFDLIPEVEQRYRNRVPPELPLEIWTFRHRIASIRRGQCLRLVARAPFQLHWSADEWNSSEDTEANTVAMGIYFVDLTAPSDRQGTFRFTFFWAQQERWEGRDYMVRFQ